MAKISPSPWLFQRARFECAPWEQRRDQRLRAQAWDAATAPGQRKQQPLQELDQALPPPAAPQQRAECLLDPAGCLVAAPVHQPDRADPERGATALSLGLGDTSDGVITPANMLVSGPLGFWQEREAAQAIKGCC